MTSSLLHQLKARYNYYEYSSFYNPTTQNKLPFTPSENALITIMNIPRSISQPSNDKFAIIFTTKVTLFSLDKGSLKLSDSKM